MTFGYAPPSRYFSALPAPCTNDVFLFSASAVHIKETTGRPTADEQNFARQRYALPTTLGRSYVGNAFAAIGLFAVVKEHPTAGACQHPRPMFDLHLQTK